MPHHDLAAVQVQVDLDAVGDGAHALHGRSAVAGAVCDELDHGSSSDPTLPRGPTESTGPVPSAN